jgi:ferredoxin
MMLRYLISMLSAVVSLQPSRQLKQRVLRSGLKRLVTRADAASIDTDTCSITWTTADGSRVIDVQRGELLRTALLRRGLSPHNNNSQLINCRGLGTCGTCAVEVRGVEPPEASARERFRLSFPPHELRPNLRLACLTCVHGDVVVSKFEGFWGAQSTPAPAAADARTYFGAPQRPYTLTSTALRLERYRLDLELTG